MPQRRRRRPGRNRSRSASLFLATVLLIAGAYIGAASSLGTWLAEHVVQPVFSTLGIFQSVPSPSPGAPEGTDTPAQQSVQVSMQGLTVYALQTGVFSTSENAQNEAATLQSQGGGGYVKQDGEQFRTLLSPYEKESDASSVRDQLKATMETRVYPVSCNAFSIQVNTEEQKKAIEAVLPAFDNVKKDLFAAAMSVNHTAQLPEKAKTAQKTLQDFYTKLSEAVPAGQSQKVDQWLTALKDALDHLNNGIDKGGTQLAAQIQYACLQVCCSYCALSS